jgi:hypothetical protein
MLEVGRDLCVSRKEEEEEDIVEHSREVVEHEILVMINVVSCRTALTQRTTRGPLGSSAFPTLSSQRITTNTTRVRARFTCLRAFATPALFPIPGH